MKRNTYFVIFCIMALFLAFTSIKTVNADTLSEGTLTKEKYPCFRDAKPLALENNEEIYFLTECSESPGGGFTLYSSLSEISKYGEIFAIGDTITVTGTIYEAAECSYGGETHTYNYICIDSINLVNSIVNESVKITVKLDGILSENIHLQITSGGIIKEGCTNSNGEWDTDLKPSNYIIAAPNYQHIQTIEVSSSDTNHFYVNLSSEYLVENPTDFCNKNKETDTNDSSTEDKDNGSPGFELIFLITALGIILYIKRRK